jgi:hypothetical protein
MSDDDWIHPRRHLDPDRRGGDARLLDRIGVLRGHSPGQEAGDPAGLLRYSVWGGAFEASGGHQVMPHRDERPPEAEQYRERQQQEAGHGQRTLLPAGHR